MNSLDQRIADGSSRAAVLKVLRDRGELVRVEDLAEAVKLSLSAVRFHLERLISDGLVRTAKEPRLRPGRPRVMYQAVPEEAVDDAAAYRRLAGLLALELADHGGQAAAEAAGRTWAGQLVAASLGPSVPGSLQGSSGAAPAVIPAPAGGRAARNRPAPPESLSGIMAILQDGGFEPTVRDDGWTIELHRCPFAELMSEASDIVCAVHQGMVRALPGLRGSDDTAVLFPAPDVDAPCVVRFRDH